MTELTLVWSEGEPMGRDARRFPLSDELDRRALHDALTQTPGIDDFAIARRHLLVVARAPRPALVLRLTVRAHTPTRHQVPVVYDGEDLSLVAQAIGLSVEELQHEHARTYRVAMLGFLPGFAYLEGLSPRLAALPRRDRPRAIVPAGAVAVGGGFTGIYPCASPGGWHLLGRTSLSMLDGDAPRWALGDEVELVPATTLVERPVSSRAASNIGELEVVHVEGAAYVQANTRRRRAAGLPEGGPLDRARATRALRTAGLDDDDAYLECFGALVLRAGARVVHVTDGHGRVVRIAPRSEHRFALGPDRHVHYLAFDRPIDVPSVLGSRGTLVAIARGGLGGRALRRGDRLSLGDMVPRSIVAAPARVARPRPDALEVVLGPDLHGSRAAFDAATIDQLFATPYRVTPTRSRVGLRLEAVDGRPLATRIVGAWDSVPCIAGAIEVPPDGTPVVLGPEHPVTGGYPLLGVVTPASLDVLQSLPSGQVVRFRPAPPGAT